MKNFKRIFKVFSKNFPRKENQIDTFPFFLLVHEWEYDLVDVVRILDVLSLECDFSDLLLGLIQERDHFLGEVNEIMQNLPIF